MTTSQAISKLIECKDHPRYMAARKPRGLCEACWARWTFTKMFREQTRELLERVGRRSASRKRS